MAIGNIQGYIKYCNHNNGYWEYLGISIEYYNHNNHSKSTLPSKEKLQRHLTNVKSSICFFKIGTQNKFLMNIICETISGPFMSMIMMYMMVTMRLLRLMMVMTHQWRVCVRFWSSLTTVWKSLQPAVGDKENYPFLFLIFIPRPHFSSSSLYFLLFLTFLPHP